MSLEAPMTYDLDEALLRTVVERSAYFWYDFQRFVLFSIMLVSWPLSSCFAKCSHNTPQRSTNFSSACSSLASRIAKLKEHGGQNWRCSQ